MGALGPCFSMCTHPNVFLLRGDVNSAPGVLRFLAHKLRRVERLCNVLKR